MTCIFLTIKILFSSSYIIYFITLDIFISLISCLSNRSRLSIFYKKSNTAGDHSFKIAFKILDKIYPLHVFLADYYMVWKGKIKKHFWLQLLKTNIACVPPSNWSIRNSKCYFRWTNLNQHFVESLLADAQFKFKIIVLLYQNRDP